MVNAHVSSESMQVGKLKRNPVYLRISYRRPHGVHHRKKQELFERRLNMDSLRPLKRSESLKRKRKQDSFE